MQHDLFALADDADRRCGTCVHRNAAREDDTGPCAPFPVAHGPDDPPCDWWFAKTQLRASLYGR
jgi:hypothetical protein